MEEENTRLSGFKVLDQWGEMDSVKDRRFYLKRLVLHASGGQIRKAKFFPGGYDHDTSDLFLVNEPASEVAVRLQLEVINKLQDYPDCIKPYSPEWQSLQEKMILLSREYKVHLQPKEKFIPDVVSCLAELITADPFLQNNIVGFKSRVFTKLDHGYGNRATIVIYLALIRKRHEARAMCCQVLARLKAGLVDHEDCAEGRLPIYNYPVTELMSFTQTGTGVKFELKRILGPYRFNKLFPQKHYQALLMDERPEYYLPRV